MGAVLTAGPGTGVVVDAAPAEEERPRGRLLVVVAFMLAVLAPVAVFGSVADRQLVHIDGAMNLHVAERLAHHGQYARMYDFVPSGGAETAPAWLRYHPSEVQTNGPFIAVAATAIWFLGTSQLALQLANLVFLAALAAVLWLLLR